MKSYQVDKDGYYGEFGGAYIPEILHKCVEELTNTYLTVLNDESFKQEFDQLLRDYVGRPSPLYLARRLSEKYGCKIYLKREDLNHTGAHKINNTIGQILLARRMGKTRIIAETGAGQHGVATATVCALMNMECIVYMGKTDVERQHVNVEKMKMLGATVIPVTSGNMTLKDATNEAIRDWCCHPADTYYIIGSTVGPHPYPDMVARLQSVISEEIKKQLKEKEGRDCPDYLIACVGGGSNAAGTIYHYLDDERVRIAVWAPNFHAAEALVEGAMLKAVELANRLAREYVLGCAGAEDPAVLHANHPVGAFLRELEFVDGHDDSHIPRFRKVAKYSQQVDLVADIEIRCGLVEHEHTRILRDGACEHDALVLPVAYLHEVALGELFHMCGFHGLVDPTVVVRRECAHSPGVGMPSRLYDIAAGEELGPGAICQHNGKVPCELRRLPSGNLSPVELDRAGKRCQMACDGFQDGRLARAVRPDERHDVARANLQIDAFDYDLLVVARRQVAYAEKRRSVSLRFDRGFEVRLPSERFGPRHEFPHLPHSFLQHERDNHRRAEDGGDGADGKLDGREQRARDQIAARAEDGASQEARRNHADGLRRLQRRLNEMRNRDAYERHRTSERGHAGGEHAR